MKVLELVNEETLAKELFELIQTRLANAKREEELKEHFKAAPGAKTGKVVYGEYEVNVASNSKTVMDQDAVKVLLGSQTPYKQSLQVQCSVKRLASAR